MFRIYYSDKMVEGSTGKEWKEAPDQDVQVVALFGKFMVDKPEAELAGCRHETGYVACGAHDRQLFTGVTRYDPLGWGIKYGKWIPNDDYARIWERALGDD